MTKITVDQLQNMDGDDVMREGFSKFFGEKLDKGMPLIKAVGAIVFKHVGERGAVPFSRAAESFALSRNPGNPQAAADMGRKAEKIWRHAVPFVPNMVEGAKSVFKDTRHYKTINQSFRQALTAHHGRNHGYVTMFRTDLEVVRNMRSDVAKKVGNSAKSWVLDLVGTIPVWLSGQFEQLIEDMDVSRRNKRNKKRKSGLTSEDAEQMRQQFSERANRTVDATLDRLQTRDSREEREQSPTAERQYSSVLEGLLEGFTDVKLDNLHTADTNRVTELRLIKKTIFDDKVLGLIKLGVAKVSAYFTRRGDGKVEKNSAGTMIVALQKALKKNPSLVRVSLPGASEKDIRLEQYIEEIFHQNEKDCGRVDIPSLVEDDLKEASKMIAQAMTDPSRQLKPEALALMIDRKYGILKRSSGKVHEVMEPAALIDHMQLLTGEKGLSNRRKQKPEQYFDEQQIDPEDFQDIWEYLTEDEKMVWGTLFPVEALRYIGASEKVIDEMQANTYNLWKEVFAATFDEVRKMSRSALKDQGLSNTEINEVEELVKDAKAHMSGNSDPLEKNRYKAMKWTARITAKMEGDQVKDILGKAIEQRQKIDALRAEEAELSFEEKMKRSGKKEEKTSR